MVGLEQICNIKIIGANTGFTIVMEIEWIALYCSAAAVGTTPSDTFLLLAAGDTCLALPSTHGRDKRVTMIEENTPFLLPWLKRVQET